MVSTKGLQPAMALRHQARCESRCGQCFSSTRHVVGHDLPASHTGVQSASPHTLAAGIPACCSHMPCARMMCQAEVDALRAWGAFGEAIG